MKFCAENYPLNRLGSLPSFVASLCAKLHAVTDGEGRPIMLMLSKGQLSDHTGGKLLFPHLPAAETLIADESYDSDQHRDALAATGIMPCILPGSNRIANIICKKDLYKTRGSIEIIFGRLKDWRPIARRYDRAVHTFLSATYVAATVFFWL